MKFIPDQPETTAAFVPFFEDSSELEISGRGTHKSIAELRTEIEDELVRLGARRVKFAEGKFDTTPTRYGFIVSFLFHDHEAQIDVAALPLKKFTDAKKESALKQALYLLRNWVRSEREAALYRPTSQPLLPYVLSDDGQKTLIQVAAQKLGVPLLTTGA
jgi:hypothetical protein